MKNPNDITVLRLKDAIIKSGLTLSQLEDKTGIPKSAIQRYSTGATDKIPINRIKAIAPHLGVTAAYLMGWEDNPQDKKETLANHVATKIKLARKQKGFSINDLANAVGVSNEDLISMENGIDRSFSPELMFKFSRALDVQPSFFLGRDNESNMYDNFRILLEINMKSIEDFSSSTRIDSDLVNAYVDGIMPIPYSIIDIISDYFGITPEMFVLEDFDNKKNSDAFRFEIRMRYLSRLWLDYVGFTDYTDDQLMKIMDYAKSIHE